ncbi:hypothetical protein DRN74_05855 [Candidatus Micrarchaeota archaeon]|nr:MAG: hypothetical protein DRN74_05855 [Candidatus Micrarchaeota archaeon]
MPAVLAVVFIAERVASRRDSKANAKKINVEQIYEKTCREAAGEIGRGRYREAIEIFSKFAEDHPFTHEQEIKGKISALKSLIQKQEEADEESKTLESEEEKRS